MYLLLVATCRAVLLMQHYRRKQTFFTGSNSYRKEVYREKDQHQDSWSHGPHRCVALARGISSS